MKAETVPSLVFLDLCMCTTFIKSDHRFKKRHNKKTTTYTLNVQCSAKRDFIYKCSLNPNVNQVQTVIQCGAVADWNHSFGFVLVYP